MGRAQTAEVPALHAAGEALALGTTLDVDQLIGDEVRRGDLRADVDQRILGDAELGDIGLGLDLGLAEVAALRLGDVLRLLGARAELERDIAVAVRLAARDDLHALERQDGDRHVAAVLLEQAGHPHLLRDHAGAHDPFLPIRGSAGSVTNEKGPGDPRPNPSNPNMPPPGLVPLPKEQRWGLGGS